MVAQNSANFHIFRGHARQRGRSFGALAQTLERTAIPFIKKSIVPAAKRIEADLFEIAAPEIGEIVSGRRKFKTFANDVGTKTVRKHLGGGKKKSKRRTRSISRKSRLKTNRSRENIFDNLKRVKIKVIFGTELLQIFYKVPVLETILSSYIQEVFPNTSLDESSIEFEFKTECNLYLDMRDTQLSLKLQLFKGRLFDAFKDEKAEHKAKSEDDSDEEPKSYLTYVKNLIHSLFSNCEVYFNNTMAYNANGLYPHKAPLSNELNSSAVSNEGILACHGYIFEEYPEAFDMYYFTDRANSVGSGIIFSLFHFFTFYDQKPKFELNYLELDLIFTCY